MSEASRTTTSEARETRPAASAEETHAIAGADLGNLAVQHALRGGGLGAALPGPPMGNQDEQRSQPVRCPTCEAKSQRYGVQAKCGECGTRAGRTAEDANKSHYGAPRASKDAAPPQQSKASPALGPATREMFQVSSWNASRNPGAFASGNRDGGFVSIHSPGMMAKASVHATTPAAEHYAIGFFQTVRSSIRRFIYQPADQKAYAAADIVRTNAMDQLTAVSPRAPWYNHPLEPMGPEAAPAMSDHPFLRAPTANDGAPLTATEGGDLFTTYLVAAPSGESGASGAIFLGSVDWQLDWHGAVDANLGFHGGQLQVGHAITTGRSDAQTGGLAANAMGQSHGAPEPFVASSADKTGSAFFGAFTAQTWMWHYGDKLLSSLGDYLAGTELVMPSTFATWKAGSPADFAKAMWAPMLGMKGKGQPYAGLGRILAPDTLDPLINAGRDAPTGVKQDPFTGDPIDPKGTIFWMDSVVGEVGKFVVKRVIESLARVMPRWMIARNQLALSSEGPAKTADRDPSQKEVIASHPIDTYVISGLENHVAVNLREYRLQNPDQNKLGDMHLGELRKVPYRWLHDQGAWNWIECLDPTATKEDVAFTLYGDSTFAHGITDAAPMFGISNVEELGDLAKSEYAQHATKAKKPPGTGDDPAIADPEQQMQAPSLLSDQVMLAEAKNIKPSGIKADEDGRKVLIDRMQACLQLFQMIFKKSQAMPAGGYSNLLDAAYKRVQDRAFKTADRANSMNWIVAWDGQTQSQKDLLTQALNGITVAVQQYDTFKAWPSSGLVTQQIGWMYLKVASLSEQATAGQEALAAANQQSKLFPVTVMELLLAEIRKVLHTERGQKYKDAAPGETDEKHDTRTDLKEHDEREAKLRLGLARVRDKLLQNQAGAEEDLKKLVKELTDLQNEVAMVADMDAMERAWEALYQDISYVGVISGSNSDDLEMINGKKGHDRKSNPALREMHQDWQRIYARYRKGEKKEALAELDELRPKWNALYPKIGELIKDNETKNKWVTFGILVGIALITAGVGAYVEGAAAAAWGAGSWATFAATTGAEALTFTTLSYGFVEKDPSIGGFFLELGKNLLMFGALKGISSKYIQFVGKDVAGAVDTMTVQFVSINTASLVEADIKKKLKTGQHLTMDEVFEISKQNALFTIASGLATAAARPGLESLKLEGVADGSLAKLRKTKAELKTLAVQVQAAKTTDPAKVNELLAKQREALADEEAALQNLEQLAADPKKAKKAGLDDAMVKRIDAERQVHDATRRTVLLDSILRATEGAGPVRYAEHGQKWQSVVDFWKGQDGAKVENVPVDEQLGSRAVEVTTKDGETFRLIERTAENAKAVSKSEMALPEAESGDPQAAAEASRLERIRTGEPGKIRGEAELSNQDVADVMNAQLQKFKPGDIEAIINKFPPDQQANARRVLARSSGFATMESLTKLRAELASLLPKDAKAAAQPGARRVYTPGGGALGDTMAYLEGKKAFKGAEGTINITEKIEPNCIVILDDVVLAQLRDPAKGPQFAKSLIDAKAVLVQPRGFDSGINMFDSATPDVVQQRMKVILDKANELVSSSNGTMTFDDAVTTALDLNVQNTLNAADPALTDPARLKVVDAASNPDVSNAAMADQLNGGGGITAEQIEAILSQVKSEADRAMFRELLAQQAEVFSPRRIAKEMLAQHQKAMDLAKQQGMKAEDVFFLIPDASKDKTTGKASAGGSFNLMAMAHREATGTDMSRYINGTAALQKMVDAGLIGKDTMIVILDDVAGSGHSLVTAADMAQGVGYEGKILVAPLVSTTDATGLFGTLGKPEVTYMPNKVMQAIKMSPLFLKLSVPQQVQLEAILQDLGYPYNPGNGLSMAFPYMAPDNNNAFFGEAIAKYFIMNQNVDASKSRGWTPK